MFECNQCNFYSNCRSRMEDLSFVPDLPTGPLDIYRNSASFDWKRLKLALEGDLELLKLKVGKFTLF